jgi:hypothetical protein
VLGRPVAVHCVATNLAGPNVSAAERGDELVAQARRVFQDDLVDVAEVE